ncbi:MAG TPA: tripartite tricarboxylate transporter substrate binding protein [Lautropia sp.]|jgi:tripartite-type tricarboxylate transporter receptor subunit TctC|nr:tripartite tricarboxylate transporter substrate binding protein [Lautropia sp.]
MKTILRAIPAVLSSVTLTAPVLSTSLLTATVMFGAAMLATGAAQAQNYPDRPIRLIIPFTPGGGTDNLSRLVGNKLQERNKWTIVMENKAGASGTIGIAEAVKAPPTGYELVMGQADNLAVSPLLNKAVAYDPLKDLQPVAHVADVPIILLTATSKPYKTLSDVIEAAKGAPGKITFASAGAGTVSHLVGELLGTTAKVDIRHVPYKGSAPALADLLGGHIDLMTSSVSSAVAQIKAGTARGLAVSTARRSSVLPEVPTVAESGYPGFDVATWYGLYAPAGVPKPIVTLLNSEVNKVLPELREAINGQGGELRILTPEAFGDLLKSDIAKWRDVIQAGNIKLE